MKKILFLIGESGCGKTYLQSRLMGYQPNYYAKITSTATREKRPGELEGMDYHFVSVPEFLKSIEDNEFIQDDCFGNNYYGTKKIEYQKSAEVGIFVCTPTGIMDTINGLKEAGMVFQYGIVLFFTTKQLLRNHEIEQGRIDRGDILGDFLTRYTDNEFDGIPIKIYQDSDIGYSIQWGLHREITCGRFYELRDSICK